MMDKRQNKGIPEKDHVLEGEWTRKATVLP
jgi:hypothetical protein